ncbi:hypothetical protein Bca4012_076270 [Brassica carinata]|uniref:Uncharacterized protein n=2 Tax=Brassica TaxID=3705 RepID=A0A8X7Q9W8_BRACI|nr:hypothetical protein Bca52824_073364 [Brassica carinata]VDD35882.1 unnamed protein product [Brassica oleracea]
MTSSKLHFVVLLIIISFILNIQSARIIDDSSSDCEFKGPCQKKTDCYERCGVGKPPFKIALCEPYGSSRVCCCV